MVSYSKLKPVLNYLIPLCALVWAVIANMLLIETGDMALTLSYNAYLVFLVSTLFFCRANLFQPIGLSTLLGFLAFGNNIPFFSRGYIRDVTIDSNILFKVLIVFMLAQIAFIAGSLINAKKTQPFSFVFQSKFKPINLQFHHLLGLLLFVGLAGAFRLHFNIGAAKQHATIPFSGYFHYALLDGLLMVIAWCLVRGFKKSFSMTFLALLAVLGLVITQALLGWRGMIFRALVCVTTAFWFQKKLYRSDKLRSFAWIVILAFFGMSAIQLGNATRAKQSGSDGRFATSASDFIQKLQMRSQGTTRLAAVIEYFGPGLTVKNDWMAIKLFKRNDSTAGFVDRQIYGIDKSLRKHSVGCSGPGSPYVGAGLIGVALAYFVWGFFIKGVYNQIGFSEKKESNFLAIAYYCTLIDILLHTYSENFNDGVVKKLIAITCIAFACKIFLFSSRKLKDTMPTGSLDTNAVYPVANS